MRVSHVVSADFDDPNLVAVAGLGPVLGLAERAGLHDLVDQHVQVRAEGGANPVAKVVSVVAGMVAGADSIDDMDLLRHGGMGRLFGGVRAPSTLGTFLRCLRWGHVRQLGAVASRFLAALVMICPVLRDAAQVAYVDVDDTVRQVHGYAKQGAGFGYSGVRGLNALIASVSTPTSAPMIAATRLRKGSAASVRGAASLVAEAIGTARAAGATGLVIARFDSAFYTADVLAACHRAGARFSVTARANSAVKAAISGIPETAWVPIRYPEAIWDEEGQCWLSQAEVAEVEVFTAFTSRRKADQVTARLIVRRVRRLNPATAPDQDELFAAYRYHAVFTNSPFTTLEAESCHRGHAIIEQVIADLKNSALAHLPSAKFTANAAWLTLAAIAFNLTRAAGATASPFHAKATTATVRTHLIGVPARLARSGRRLRLHLPTGWSWTTAWTQLFNAVHGPPAAAAP
ncbi:MAG: IS1380 family transposase [Mycobacterium sp.]